MSKKLTLEEFIEKAKKVHGERYDYSLVEYINNSTKVKIVCKEHGEFEQRPNHHFQGVGCPACGFITMSKIKIKSKEYYLLKANKIHNNKYDYSKFIYINSETKGIIICPIHGEFLQAMTVHIHNHGCPHCGYDKVSDILRLDFSSFIKRANEIHNFKYDYSLVNYISSKIKIQIICPEHGIFEQTPSNHLKGRKCVKCSIEQSAKNFKNKKHLYYGCLKKTTESWVKEAQKRYGNKYDYSLTEYKNAQTKIKIICPKEGHGIFIITPRNHLRGQACPKCSGSFLDTKFFIFKSKKLFGDIYDYSLSEVSSATEKVKIICPIHGEFLMTPNKHFQGQGCKYCINTSKFELIVKAFLENNNIKFEMQKKFKDCFYKQALRFDFYLFEKNILIEADGSQHENIEQMAFLRRATIEESEKEFGLLKLRDAIKTEWAKEKEIRLIRIPYSKRLKLEEFLLPQLT